MSVDRTKVLEAAQKHLAKGNYDRAIGELRRIVQADPTDVRTLLKIGDLYTRSGSRTEAIETYARVAHQYGDQGFFLKAVAVYKQILKLDPSRLDIQIKLAEMYEMLQLVSDALSTYEHVVSGYARTGDMERALETLKKMTALDPENIPIRIKAAEALSKAGRRDEAAEEFEAGANLLREQGRFDDYLKVAERLLYHRPDDVQLARELASTYLERQDPKRALSKLQLCFKADPKDIATLELLAEAFNQLGQLPKTISVYKEVARIHQEAGRDDERARILKRVLELDPGDREARQGLAGYAQGSAASVPRDIQPPASAVVAPTQGAATQVSGQAYVEPEEYEDAELAYEEPDDELADLEVIDAAEEEDDILIVEEEDIEPMAAPSRSIPPDVQREAQIARLLTECDVFMRYGLKQKVVEQLHAVLQIEPLHVEARERLKDIYIEDGRLLDAVAELISLADILADEQSAAATLYLRQVLEIEPGNPEALRRLEQLGASIPPPAMAAPPAASDVFDELPPAPAVAEASVEDEVFFLDDESGVDMASGSGVVVSPPHEPFPERTRMDAAPLPDPVADRTQIGAAPLTEDEEGMPSTASGAPAYDSTIVAARPALVPPPGTISTADPEVVPIPRPADPLAPMTPEEFEDVPIRPSHPGNLAPVVSSRPPGEVEETLDEADFFVAQGLVDEARAALEDALASYPNHPLILEKLREIGAAPQSSAAPPPEEPSVDQSFELAEKLAQDFSDADDETTSAGSDVLDVEQVFAQFKKGVEAQVGMEDTETHFDLGIAYKEMGLIDDAINEFKLCLSNPQRVCIAETMIGLCSIEKGELTEAIGHFKKGLYADTKSDREELGLYYELGNAYELLRDFKEAIFYFQKVEKRDPSFRSVATRIQNLSQPRSSANQPSVQLGQDDIDAAFDDLMGED